jgi:hypothetical protein
MLAGLCAVMVTGCAVGGFGPPSPVRVDTHEQELRQAHDALDRWAEAVSAAGEDQLSIPLREGIQVVGELTPDEWRALRSGALRLHEELPLPDQYPYEADSRIVWPDGSSLPVSAIPAAQAFHGITVLGETCPDCVPLNIVDISPGTMEISTSRGPATAPAWRFTLEKSSATLIALAVGEAVGVWPTPPPWDAVNPPAGRSIDGAVVSSDDRHLRVGLIGARTGADTPCGEDYTAETVESDLAVVVIIIVATYGDLHPEQGERFCTMMGYPRTATAELAAPLGDRAVLEVREGLPVRVVREPALMSR